jgi:hypothetical protein
MRSNTQTSITIHTVPNRLRFFRLDKLKIFPEAEHPFEGLDLVSGGWEMVVKAWKWW